MHAMQLLMLIQRRNKLSKTLEADITVGKATVQHDWAADLLRPMAVSACMRVRSTSSGCDTESTAARSTETTQLPRSGAVMRHDKR
jgi:hypothetical protein